MVARGPGGLGADWPDAWFTAPQTASEAGLTSFSQSPFFEGRDLPPLADRLPDDPLVIEPYQRLGTYGGTARITLGDAWQFFSIESALTISADMREILPNLARSFEVSADGTTTTIQLRRGLKWSDGMPLTADDFGFTFNHIFLDKEYSPVTLRQIQGGRFVRIDDLTFQYVFDRPNPLFINLLAQFGNFLVDPAHYFRNWHPAFVDRGELAERVKARGILNWTTFVDAQRNERIEDSAEVPTLRAFRLVSRTPTLMRWERNPYYHKIDPTGRQLPYMDAVEAEIILDNGELVTAKASTGQLDFAAFALRTQDLPILKLGEQAGLVDVHVWRRLHTSDVLIQFNYNYEDDKLRELYWDKRFRQALSYAINRREMNEIIYFGRGVPQQASAHPTSMFYEEAFSQAHAAFDPDKARALLDEIGLKDVDGDGLREYPDGEPLIMTVEYIDFETPKAISMELVSTYWRNIGMDIRLKLVNRALQSERAVAGKMQMTLWHADKVTDVLYPINPNWFAPMYTGWENVLWNDWARYYLTGGEVGEEPPPVIRELQRHVDTLRHTIDVDERIAAGKALLRSTAENTWTMGTVGLAPHPVVVSKRLQNVIPNGIWGWDHRWTLSYHPATWFLEQP